MLREYRLVVVQRQSNGSQVNLEVTGGLGDRETSIHGGRLKAPPSARVAAVDVNWKGSQVKEHHENHRQMVKTTAASTTCEVRKTSSGEFIGWRPEEHSDQSIGSGVLGPSGIVWNFKYFALT